MYVGKVLSFFDVVNISISGFLLVFFELALLYGFIKLMIWAMDKIQNKNETGAV